MRRRLREVVRLAPQAPMRPGYDYVLIGRRTALDLPFDRLIEDFGARLAGCMLAAAVRHPTCGHEIERRT